MVVDAKIKKNKNAGHKESNMFDFKQIARELVLFSRKVNTLSKSIDYIIEEGMPAIFKEENIEKVYQEAKKGLDYLMRHLI